MPNMHEEAKGFFVYVIEPPSAPDIYNRRSEGYFIQNVDKEYSIT